MSDSYDFSDLRFQIQDQPIVRHKKGESVIQGKPNNSPVFRAQTNILLVKDVYIGNSMNGDCGGIIPRLRDVFDKLKSGIGDNHQDIKREVYIRARIHNDQFGFELNAEFVKLLSEYGYSIGFSGIVLL
jgi:hypothetical protein